MTFQRTLLLIFLFVFPLANTTFAESPAPTKSCLDEAKKLCHGQDVGIGLGKCIQSHQSDLSQACQKKLAELKSQMQSTIKDCREDARRLCKEVQPGGGRIVDCMIARQNDLSPACKSRVAKGLELLSENQK